MPARLENLWKTQIWINKMPLYAPCLPDTFKKVMAARNPEMTARNALIDDLTAQLKKMLPGVLAETGIESDMSVNAKYGGKFANYLDIKNAVIHSPDHFIGLYLEGFKREAEASHPGSAHAINFAVLRASPKLQDYLQIFLKRVYLRNYDALSKKRPSVEDAAVWIGQNNASYGLLVTPRFNPRKGEWENDKSEIRHFEPAYWSVGHVLKTGLVIPGKDQRMTFAAVEEYLNFFLNVLVRNSGSKHEYGLAQKYCEYVCAAPDPLAIPLLIPEFRYDGPELKHKYRLDFTIITTPDLTKYGFELSPWSTHGYLSKTKQLTQDEINKLALDNFEKEMRRHKDFFLKHGIFVLIYTDSDLTNLSLIFEDMKRHLEPKESATQLRFHLIRELLGDR